MPRMLDKAGKFQVLGVAVLAVGAMAGVVLWALHARARGDDGSLSGVVGRTGTGPGAGVRERHEMPPDCEPDPAHPPRLVFEGLKAGQEGGQGTDVLDLGDVKQGVEEERRVTVKNAGEGDLCIADVETGCGCVKVELSGPARVKPGEATAVKVRINTANREGKQRKDVTVWTNEPKRREARFQVVVNVRLGVVVEGAASVYFGRHPVGTPGYATVKLKSPKDDPEWTVTAVEGTAAAYSFTVAPTTSAEDPEMRAIELRIRHPGLAKEDTFTDTLKIRTTHPDRPEITIGASMMAVQKYYTSPKERVSFGFVGSGAVPVQRQVYVWPGEDGTPFRIRRAAIEGTGYLASEPKPSVNSGWVVDVRYDGKSRAAGAVVEAVLVIEVDDPEAEPMKVPLTGTVREKP